MTIVPLLAVSNEIFTIGVLFGSIFVILLLMEMQICQLRRRVLEEKEIKRKKKFDSHSWQKGLEYFSTPTVVIGPWAGNTRVSSGKVKICLRMFVI